MAIKKVSKKLDKNTTIKKKVGREPEEVIQEGAELPRKVNKPFSNNTVGLNIGVTINLGDFQSLRIDCWASEDVKEGQDKQAVLLELTSMVQDHINYVASEMQE